MGGKQSSQCYCRTKRHTTYGSPSNTNPLLYSYPANFSDNYNGSSKLQSRYKIIGYDYHSLEQVTQALAEAGLESPNLILGIDFTKSNEWMGATSFQHRCLHHLGAELANPYKEAISIIGRTLYGYDEGNLIPCYGFGDETTYDQEVFSFFPGDRPCKGFEEVLTRYREIVPHLKLAGPTSFAPIIEVAIAIADSNRGQYHVLMIIADGQITRRVDTEYGQLSPQEQNTFDAIVKASEYPLSIILVGVGDGPWDKMHKFDNNIQSRAFDNFQFVNLMGIMLKDIPISNKETEFALEALMKLPSQYKATTDLQLLGFSRRATRKLPLPPPVKNILIEYRPEFIRSNSTEDKTKHGYSPKKENSSPKWCCPVCLWSNKDLAFGCGHQTCYDCGKNLILCPLCRSQINTKTKLYD